MAAGTPEKLDAILDDIGEELRGTAPSVSARFKEAVLEFFWLERRLASATRQAFSPGQAGWSELALARAALRHGDLLSAARGESNPAMLLYRSSARLVIRAQRRRAGTTEDRPDAGDDWLAFAELPANAASMNRLSDEHVELLRVGLGIHGESELAQMPRERAEQASRALRELAMLVGAPLAKEASQVRRIVVSRWVRIGSAFGFAILIACAIFAKLTYRPNLALHRPVSVPSVDADYADTARLVDGNRTNLGFHATGAPHVATIDLGRPQRISRVVVYNRTDCCEERAVPLSIELAEHDEFGRVADRDSTFHVWRVDFPPVVARYVRLSSSNKAPFHLSEVEVY